MNISNNKDSFFERINNRSERERALILAVILATIYVIFFHFILPAMDSTRETLKNNIDLVQAQISIRSEDIHRIAGQSLQNSDVAKQTRIGNINRQLNSMGENWIKLSTGLISPHEMTQLVENILAQQTGIDIIRVENLPATPLIEVENESNEPVATPPSAAIYKHGLYLEVRGKYFNTAKLLRELESLPWQVIWGGFDLHSESPPYSTVSLTLYTLSFGKTWLEI